MGSDHTVRLEGWVKRLHMLLDEMEPCYGAHQPFLVHCVRMAAHFADDEIRSRGDAIPDGVEGVVG